MKNPGSNLLLCVMVAAMALQLSGCKPDISSQADKETDAPKVAALSVTVVQPQSEQWPQSTTANGPIKAWQEMVVSPQTSGLRVEEMRVEVGAQVKRGDLLARLSDRTVLAEVQKNEAAVAQAKAQLKQALSNHERATASAQSGALSAQQIEEYRISRDVARATLQSSQADLDSVKIKLSQTRILAQDDGIIASRTGVLGEVAASGAELYRMIRQGRLEWLPEVDARQLSAIVIGQKVTLTLPDGQAATGQVRLIGPVLDSDKGRATVYVTLDAGSARAGMFASGKILGTDSAAMTLPQAAITQKDGRAYVWLVSENHTVASRAVTLGRMQGSRVEVLSGIGLQDSLVASGGSFLSEGATVKVLAGTAPETAGGKP